MNKFIVGMTFISFVAMTGCATIIRGTEQNVHVNTDPVGAKINFSNGQSCFSPCSIKTKRDQSLVITISKENCSTQTATMIPTLAGGGVILGGLIDYGTGAVYDLQPNPLTITLACTAPVAQNKAEKMVSDDQNRLLINEVETNGKK